jgi:septal ring factor EnvC (AmiA/AmiB activator)
MINKKMLVVISGFMVLASTSIWSASDVSASVIKRVSDEGYIVGKFDADSPVTQKDLVVAIDRLLTQMDQKGITMSQADIQELAKLSKTFKKYLADVEASASKAEGSVTKLSEDHLTLNNDISQVQLNLEDKMTEMKKENDQKNFWMMVGIAVAATIGIVAR